MQPTFPEAADGTGNISMEETQRLMSDFELFWRAADLWMPAGYSHAYQVGLLGDVFRGSGKALLASDLTHLLIPSLSALGIEARFAPLPSKGPYQGWLLPETDAILLFGFAHSLEFVPPEEIDDSTPLPTASDPQITAQALYTAETAEDLFQQATVGSAEHDPLLRTRFSHALCLHYSGMKAPNRSSFLGALHRWLAWHAAYPERAPREADLTDPSCGLAAAFLSKAVGTRHDFISNRLRYAAQCFEAAQIECAYRWLQEASIAVWQLPEAAAEALRTPPGDLPLSDVLRRELIYLARAGTLALKTLAARRLTHERHHPDAHKTLHQLRFDLDPWVRAAARPALR